MKNLFSFAAISGLGSVLAGYFAKSLLQPAGEVLEDASQAKVMAFAAEAAPAANQSTHLGFYFTLFFVGALFAFVIFSLLNWKKR